MVKQSNLSFIIMTLFSALAISVVAAYFSIAGLIAIFSALPMAILAMGVVLEIAKLVTASWVYQYWERIGFLMKTYMILAVIVLSIITSVGIFGFLSKAHMDQAASSGDAGAEVVRLQSLVDREKEKITTLEDRIQRIEDGGVLDVTESIRQQEEIRDTSWERIQGDIDYSEQQIDKIRASLDTDLALQQSKVDGLDAIVASYTSQGTTGGAFNRRDNVATGLEVREEQKTERGVIDDKMTELRGYAEQQISGYRNQIVEYRTSTQTTIDNANAEINRLRDNEGSAQSNRDIQIDDLQGQIDAVYISIEDYSTDLYAKNSVVRELEQEIGPIKYVAQLLYGESGTAAVDKAVQFVIMLLIFVFDPLAIILVIAANLSLKERRGERIYAVAVMPDNATSVVMDDEIEAVEDEPQESVEIAQEDVQESVPELEAGEKPEEGSWAASSSITTKDPWQQYFKLKDEVKVREDVDILIELPADGTLGPEHLKGPIILAHDDDDEWVSNKYGKESAMDPKKEVDLQWLIDKKKGNK
jgi:peptidoglycan hydrolase CwlO-like protein|tara:strand:- start:637 stop:2226 length:1590 start_codon:yes stop_codon:yes gene_type:complete